MDMRRIIVSVLIAMCSISAFGQESHSLYMDHEFNHFDRYVYQAAVEREYLGALASFADQAPVMLAPWDPMGTLAD